MVERKMVPLYLNTMEIFYGIVFIGALCTWNDLKTSTHFRSTLLFISPG